MPRLAASTRQELREVLLHFGKSAAELHDVRSGRVNKHWRVEVGPDRYVLRRYNHQRSPAAIQYEHDVLEHIERKGWPVAVAVAARNGERLVSAHGTWYALFPFLLGKPAPVHSPRYLPIKGALLARLHRDLALLPSGSQREGFGRLSDLDAYVPNSDGRTFDAILDAFGQEQPRLAEQIRAERRTSLDELARLGYESLTESIVHGDFQNENVLFRRRRLTALLDFDLVHLDARVADIAIAIAGDCIEPPAYMSIDPESIRALVHAYHVESALSEHELRLIVPLIRAYYVWLCGFGLNRWPEGNPEKATRSLARSAGQRLPNLGARAAAIDSALRSATESGANVPA